MGSNWSAGTPRGTPGRGFLAWLLLWVSAGCAAGGVQGERPVSELEVESSRYELVRLADGVFATVAKAKLDPTMFASSLIVVRDDGVLVVDSRGSPAEGRALLAQVRAITTTPVRWLVNTHWHDDHIGGNQVFRDSFPGLTIVGGRRAAHDVRVLARERLDIRLAEVGERIAVVRRQLAPPAVADSAAPDERTALVELLAQLERHQSEIRGIELVPPTLEVVAEWQLEDPNGKSANGPADSAPPGEVRVISMGPAHTDGDVVVFLPGLGILATGDLVEEGLPWYGDGDPAGWVDALSRLSALDFSRSILSHGRVHSDRRLLDLQREFLTAAVRVATEHVRSASKPSVAANTAADANRLDQYRDAMTAELHDAASLSREQRAERFSSTVSLVFERVYSRRR